MWTWKPVEAVAVRPSEPLTEALWRCAREATAPAVRRWLEVLLRHGEGGNDQADLLLSLASGPGSAAAGPRGGEGTL